MQDSITTHFHLPLCQNFRQWAGLIDTPHVSVGLTERVGLGLMAEIDAVYDETADEFGIEFLHSAVLGIDLTDRLGAYTEYIGITGENTKYQSYAAGGFTFQISQDLILDWGAQVGLNENSEDLGVFGGFTKRF